jgi:hypothetical protein
MATSLSMALESCGIVADEDTVNKVMGAAPMQGASWEMAFAAAQHFGARITFICPATLAQVKAYTDKGVAVMIAWNPEGRPWSHASVIKDVDDEGNVTIADPNIPDPDVLTRTMPKAEFYGKWYEKAESYLVRRPAMAVEREVSPEGRQMVASAKKVDNMNPMIARVAARHMQAFQYLVAQAFVDQVGMPEHMSIMKLNSLIVQSIVSALGSPAADASMDGAKVTATESLEFEYGSARSYRDEYGQRETPDEYATIELDVPSSISATYDIRVNVRDLVVAMTQMGPTGQFFNHHKREVFNFFASRQNKIMLDKYFNMIFGRNPDLLASIDWVGIDEDGLADTYSAGLGSGLSGGPQGATTVFMGTMDFDAAHITLKALVDFDYNPSARDFDYEGADEPDEPDEDRY